MTDGALLLLAAVVVAGLVLLITALRVNTVIALFVAAAVLGLGAGLPLLSTPGAPGVIGIIGAGLGKTLGALAAIIVLGGALGALLSESGAAGQVAAALLRRTGARYLDLALMLVGFGVGISVFFPVGVLLLSPLVWKLVRETGLPTLRLALPLVAGLSVAQGLIPPHPGPMAAIALLQANVGRTILYSLLAGVPTALLAGPLLSRWLTRADQASMESQTVVTDLSQGPRRREPGVAVSVFTMLLPVVLMLSSFVTELCGVPSGHPLGRLAGIVGTPWVAMLVATALACWLLGHRCGIGPSGLWAWMQPTLWPSGQLLLIIGAGGAFSQVLQVAGVGRALTGLGVLSSVSPLVLGWLLAASFRVAVGSATVSVITAAGLIQPMLAAHPQCNRELLVLAMGAGSLVCSHVNDSGFWLVRGCFRLDTARTLRTWSVVETAIGVAALVILVGLDQLR
jgi:gluconate:H+ symporter, GntP family